jgi:hypothetical protein
MRAFRRPIICPTLVLTGLLGFAATCIEAQESGLGDGPRILAPFKQALMRALAEGLAQGPVEAIAACRIEAPAIAASISQDGVRVGRASQRLRNPANVAPEWVAPILDAYSNEPTDRAPVTVSLGDGRSGYVEPIMLQPLCLSCHGDNLAPDVASRIHELYPDDRAVGYQVGDLRGVFWAEFPRVE